MQSPFLKLRSPILPCFPCTFPETLPLPLLPTDYLQDVVSLLERQGLEYRLCCTKLLWYRPLRLDQPLYVELLYHQVCEILVDPSAMGYSIE